MGDLPETMAAAVLHGVEDVRMEDRPTPSPGPGEVLVEVVAVGVCGSDVHYYREGRIGEHVVTGPLVLGHEAAGTVAATGPAVDRLAPGVRVALEPGVPCRCCRSCREGRYNLCPDVRFLATPPVDGAFCRYVVSPEDFAHPVPDALGDEAAALLEPLSVAVWACWKAAVRAGDRVLVTGAGPIGLLVAQVAQASGAAEVTVSDFSSRRLAVAAELGATAVVEAANGTLPSGVDVLLECSGASPAVHAGLRAVRPGGRAVLVGMAPDPVTPLPTQVIQNREIALTGTFRYAGTYPTAIALASSGAVDLDRLVTGRFGLAETEDALRSASVDPEAIKAIVAPTVLTWR